MRKHYLFLLSYAAVIALGLLICNYVLKTPYTSDHFGKTFLPFTTILALMTIGYIWRQQSILLKHPPKQAYIYGVLPILPIALIACITIFTTWQWQLVFFIPIIDAILIGISEEGLFRGILLGELLKRLSPIQAILCSACMFAAFHLLNVMGGLSINEVFSQLLSTFFIGLFLGAVYVYTRNIYLPIVFHLLWDYVFLADGLNKSVYSPTLLMITVLLGCIITVVLFWKLKRRTSL